MKNLKIVFLMLLLFGVTLYAEIVPTPEKRISMDFKDASLKDVLKAFSIQSGLNFVAGQEIEDKVITLYMENESVSNALNAILQANRLTYEQKPGTNIFIVREVKIPEVETLTRVYQLNYADAQAVKELFDKMSEAKTVEVRTPEGTIETRSFIQGVLSQYGKLAADKRTNSLIVTDIPARFPMIEEAIARLDEPAPQVMIEAEILEVATSLLEKIGVDYGESFAKFTGAVNTTAFPFSRLPTGLDRAEGAVYGTISTQELTAILKLLRSDTKTRLLARPRVLTLNNQTAEIKITAETAVAYITEYYGPEARLITKPERMETGVVLAVTPTINKDGCVTITVEPKVTEPRTSKFFPAVFVDPHTRGAKTTIRVRDGDTLVMGGLISVSESKTQEKVPLLGDIPLLGRAFKYTDATTEDKELIIFITPHIIKDFYYRISKEEIPIAREFSKEADRSEAIKRALEEVN